MKKLLLVLLVGSLVFMACENGAGSNNTNSNNNVIKYEVIGTAQSVQVVMVNENLNIVQLQARPPWTYTFTKSKSEVLALSVSAVNEGETGSITVRIYINNRVQKEASNQGAYCVATADYTTQ